MVARRLERTARPLSGFPVFASVHEHTNRQNPEISQRSVHVFQTLLTGVSFIIRKKQSVNRHQREMSNGTLLAAMTTVLLEIIGVENRSHSGSELVKSDQR